MSRARACDLPVEDLVARLDDELGAPATARVDEHLAGCAACRREMELLARAGDAIASLPSAAPGADFAGRVLAAAHGTAPAARGRLLRFWPAAAVAAAALAALVLSRGGPEPAPQGSNDVAEREISDEELRAIALDLPILANLDTLRAEDDAESLIALIENLDILESVETQALDALDQIIAEGDGG